MRNSSSISTVFDTKDKCCGCGACFNICPVQAICMEEDEYGFLYPIIDKERCVNCDLCQHVCDFQNPTVENIVQSSYAAIATDRNIKMCSASGGVFAAIATTYIGRGGLVFGAVFDKHWNVCHTGVEKKEEIRKLQGSKYTQNDTGIKFQKVKEVLNQGRERYCQLKCTISETRRAHRSFVSVVRNTGYGKAEKMTDLLDRLGLGNRILGKLNKLPYLLKKC